VRHQALAAAGESDVVVVASYCPEGARISDEILELQHPAKVFYDMDAPVTLGQLESGDLDYLRGEQIREFDLVLSFTGGPALQVLHDKWHARNVRPLFGCVDSDSYRRAHPRAEFLCD